MTFSKSHYPWLQDQAPPATGAWRAILLFSGHNQRQIAVQWTLPEADGTLIYFRGSWSQLDWGCSPRLVLSLQYYECLKNKESFYF